MAVQTNSTECLIRGDADVIGLGFRLGLYFQLLSTLLLGTVRPEQAADAFIPNVFFIISLVCAAIYSSSRLNFPPGAVIACTWYPLLAYVALLPLFYRRLPHKLPFYRVMMYPAVVIATSGFAVWFWYSGLDAVHSSQCMEPRVFCFANCSAKGPIRIVFRVLTIVSLIIAIISGRGVVIFQSLSLTLFLLSDSRTPLQQGTEHDLETEVEVPGAERFQLSQIQDAPVTGTNDNGRIQESANATTEERRQDRGELSSGHHPTNSHPVATTQNTTEPMHRFRIPILGSLCMCLGITASELQLKWNHVVDINTINTSGQVLPLVLGTLSFLYTLVSLKVIIWAALKRLWMAIKRLGRFLLSILKTWWLFIVWLFGNVFGGVRFLSKYFKKVRTESHSNC